MSTTNPWTGTPLTLNVGDNAVMPQTPNGTMIFAATNTATGNNDGKITLSSGGGMPTNVEVPALANQPTIQISNWGANNLNVANQSAASATPILVQAVGPGIPGITPAALPLNTATTLKAGASAQGTASPQWMSMRIQSTSATLGILGLIGGKLVNGNNGYVISVNDGVNGNTGPGTGSPAPEGYYATTSSNTYNYQFNWGSSAVFVSNLSPSTAVDVTVTVSTL